MNGARLDLHLLPLFVLGGGLFGLGALKIFSGWNPGLQMSAVVFYAIASLEILSGFALYVKAIRRPAAWCIALGAFCGILYVSMNGPQPGCGCLGSLGELSPGQRQAMLSVIGLLALYTAGLPSTEQTVSFL